MSSSSSSSSPPRRRNYPPAALIVGSSGCVGGPVARAFRARGWSTISVDPASSSSSSSYHDNSSACGVGGAATDSCPVRRRRRSSSGSVPRARPRVAGRMRRGTGSERFRSGSLGPADAASMRNASELIKEAFGDLVGVDFDFDDLSSSSGSSSDDDDDEKEEEEAEKKEEGTTDGGGGLLGRGRSHDEEEDDDGEEEEEEEARDDKRSPIEMEARHLCRAKFFEEIDRVELVSYLAPPDDHDAGHGGAKGGWGVREIVYTADEGRRHVYADRPSTGRENEERFEAFMGRVADALKELSPKDDENGCKKKKEEVHISYIGGSWTRRAPADASSSDYLVTDESPAKPNGGDNPYEVAKTSACSRAESIAAAHSHILRITFYDYISVVPNFSPDFTVFKMVQSALEEGVVRFTEGEEYGRALLHAAQAGEIVAKLAERRLSMNEGGSGNGEEEENGHNNDDNDCFRTVLVPGSFTPFAVYAAVARNVVLQSGARDDVDLVPVSADPDTGNPPPDFLRAKCRSDLLAEALNFRPDEWMVGEGLSETAASALRDLIGRTL